MTNITDQIRTLIMRVLPYQDLNIGTDIIPTSFSVSGNQIIMQLPTTLNVVNKLYVIHNIKVKNYITSYKINSATNRIEMTIAKKPKLKVNSIFTTKGFTNAIFNTSYQVKEIRVSNEGYIIETNKPDTITSEPSQFGYIPTEYASENGYNGIKTLTKTGSNYIYNFDVNSVYNGDIDTDFTPMIIDANDSVVCWNRPMYEATEFTKQEKETILIDTGSFTTLPSRSSSNQTESEFDKVDSNANFRNDCTLTLYYILSRQNDSSTAQATSGTDIQSKQLEMIKFLNSCLNRPVSLGDKMTSSSIIPGASIVDNSVFAGRVTIAISLIFYIYWTHNIVFEDDYTSSPITSIKAGTNIINF